MPENSLHQCLVDGKNVSYFDEGIGPAVLLLHGFPMDHNQWQHQFDALANLARVIAPDFPGYGKSEPPSTRLSLSDLADWVARFVDEVNVNVPLNVVGLSMGGYIAFEIVRRQEVAIDRLVLCHTRPDADSELVERGRQMMAARVLKEGVSFVVDTMLPKLVARNNLRDAMDEIRWLRQTIGTTLPQTIANGQLSMAERSDSSDLLKQITCPTLVVAGDDDAITPSSDMRKWSEKIPTCTFVEIAEAGHLSPLENPGDFRDVLCRFLFDQGKEK